MSVLQMIRDGRNKLLEQNIHPNTVLMIREYYTALLVELEPFTRFGNTPFKVMCLDIIIINTLPSEQMILCEVVGAHD